MQREGIYYLAILKKMQKPSLGVNPYKGRENTPINLIYVAFLSPQTKKNQALSLYSLVEIWHFSRLALILHLKRN